MKKLIASFRTRAWRAGAYSVFAAMIVIAMAVVVNLAVSALPVSVTQVDLTDNQLYSLSQGTEQTLAALDKDVEIYWLTQNGYENKTMEQVLSRYAQFSRVSVTQVDPVRYPGFAAAYTDETAENNSLVIVCGERSLFIPYADVWTYSDFETYSYYMTYYGEPYLDVFTGEAKITSAIGYVTSDTLPVLYYLTGHGETGVSDSVLAALTLENIQPESLNLLTEEAVPDDCAVLAIFGPVTDLTDREAELIDAYAAQGGKLLITTEYTKEELPNFKALLGDFGIELIGGYVMENDSRYYSYGYIDLVLPAILHHAITDPLMAGEGFVVMMPDAQAMMDAATETSAATVTPLLASSATSYIKQDVEGLTNYDQSEGDQEGSFLLAAVSENRDTGAQLVVFSSTRFMESEFSDLVSGANQDLFLNGADWLCERGEIVSVHPKILSGEYLTFTDGTASAVKIVLPVVIPLLFLSVGAAIFVKRRRR